MTNEVKDPNKNKIKSGVWMLYILRCGDGSLYTGITNDLAARISAHKEGTGAKYTRGRGPLTLVYSEECENRATASKREAQVKKLPRAEKLKLIAPDLYQGQDKSVRYDARQRNIT